MSLVDIAANMEGHAALARRETQLQQLVTAYIVAGLLFLLLPGTFLGVWNLLAISADHTVTSLSPAWLQAHGHAQMFGWLGTFILGIGFYSLSKMGNLKPFAVSRGWLAFGFWTGGASLRWLANVTAWQWRVVLPFSALLELAGFLLFFFTVVSHRRPLAPGTHRKKDPWMIVVTGGAIAFLATLLVNLGSTIYVALCGDSGRPPPAVAVTSILGRARARPADWRRPPDGASIGGCKSWFRAGRSGRGATESCASRRRPRADGWRSNGAAYADAAAC
jgi:hypothetical protein